MLSRSLERCVESLNSDEDPSFDGQVRVRGRGRQLKVSW